MSLVDMFSPMPPRLLGGANTVCGHRLSHTHPKSVPPPVFYSPSAQSNFHKLRLLFLSHQKCPQPPPCTPPQAPEQPPEQQGPNSD
ncbi:hypothetical protein BD311DRAFT_778548 [Dichomitus squalens]|uniref:Uncharacterized protein n=1 Tax=Dichomitus squalens TaxID=114155 RepID=A0A4Q9MKQ6_9APHY|nr:hypothetical protein BD311DRAFT_778548 [Dichomitus squalens]